MKEKKLVRRFTLDTTIYDVELPQKVLAVLQAEPLETDPHFYYGMDIIFDKAVYQIPEFFQYPLEQTPPSPPNRRSRMTEQEQTREQIYNILGEQFQQVLSAVKDAGIDLSSGGIIGDDMKDIHHVILEFCTAEEKKYDKSGKLMPAGIVNCIMPDRPFIVRQVVDFFARMIMDKAKEDEKKKLEQASHTPNMVSAGELFTAAAKAILLDQRRKTDTEIAALAGQLRLHAEVQSDWPLEIVYAKESVTMLTEDMEIDCPEFLLYHESTDGSWDLKKVENLAAAQYQITRNGYNRRATARMAVLHNMRPMGFNLFTDTAEGLVKVKKQEAYKSKKLNLSWKK